MGLVTSIEKPKYITPYTLDAWQKEIIELPWKTNICLNIGRQSGKSDCIAIKVAETMANNPGIRILIISIVEDQAIRMLQKIILYLHDNYPKEIAKGKDKKTGAILKPTMHRVNLKNGSWAVTKAVGREGLGVLGMTVDIIVPDEAAYLPEAIWQSITPMLLTTGGVLWLLSTMNTKEGYFYKAYTEPDLGFWTKHYTSEEVAQARPEPQKSIMLQYLAREKARMTDLQYAQQYLSQALEELRSLFKEELINSCQVLERPTEVEPDGEYYLGVDVARMGGDEITFEIVQRKGDVLYHIDNQVYQHLLTTQTADKIIALERQWGFKRIYIDDGGLGVAVFDNLLKEDDTKRKIVAINNAARAINPDEWKENRRKKLLKEDLYFNLLNLMERGNIKLLKDDNLFNSLKSIIIERNEATKEVRIYGRYTHIAEGLIRAAWCMMGRPLDVYIY